jgi:hypothetical protein
LWGHPWLRFHEHLWLACRICEERLRWHALVLSGIVSRRVERGTQCREYDELLRNHTFFVPAIFAIAQTDLILTVPRRLAKITAVMAGVRVVEAPLEIKSFPYFMASATHQ